MNMLAQAQIIGFWGEKNLKFNFYEDVNFLIGVNGSGKTTAINLLVAALTANFKVLDTHEFDSIKIELRDPSTRKKPSVEIVKTPKADTPFPSIEYRIKNSASEKAIVYSLEDFEEQRLFRNYSRHLYTKEMLIRHGKSILDHLNTLVNISWLSVHRASPSDDRENKIYESTVDRKLDELSNRMVRYFSTLSKQGAELLEKFQETIFLSLLVNKRQENRLFGGTVADIEEEKKALNAIFSQFGLDEKRYQSRVNDHFNVLLSARNHMDKKEQLSSLEVAALFGTERIDHVVEEWSKMLTERAKIFETRTAFLNILNKMIQRKRFDINDENEIFVTTQSGKNLPLSNLSSGEKQLLIVLGEALLQGKARCIYIADEPEISLHVKWQESLVDNLKALNPSAQIIFATHSPDIVSKYGKCVFDMERLLV